MIDTPEIIQTTPGLTAFIHLTVLRAEIQKVMGPGIRELIAAVTAQGVAITGPWFTYHYKRPVEIFDFEISLPVAKPVVPTGRMQAGELAPRKAARTVYHGGYDGLGEGWGEFHGWIAAAGHTPATDLWECYVVGPDSGGDPSSWRTELNQPLIS